MGNLPLLAAVLFNLLGQDEAVHGQRGKDVADVNERVDIDEQVYGQRDRNRHNGHEESEKGFAGNLLPALYRTHEIEQRNRNNRYQKKRIQGTAGIMVFRGDIDETVDKRNAERQDKSGCPHAKHGVKELA